VLVAILICFNISNSGYAAASKQGFIGHGEYLSDSYCCTEEEFDKLSTTVTDQYGNEYSYSEERGKLTVELDCEQNTILTLPKLYYKGYHASINGQAVCVDEGYSQFITVNVPEGTTGDMTLEYCHPTFLKILDLLCLIMVCILIKLMLERRGTL
jgi:uncharacterized membrane protein YfhO